ncbi:hypothetical protein HELRODRAFT_176929 [Helobdella robusta]|uniref:Uncharacterized protein n=1 Tax=Helobdella robusta TaxID=6412 RepID=T1FB19_HELRO|nr:hypothetical protein HELRODRAFT_176929 [Helobdella robusta]ESN98453.1 hypothetical protein HELRODRAFT_176929 [Helobdella robusta]
MKCSCLTVCNYKLRRKLKKAINRAMSLLDDNNCHSTLLHVLSSPNNKNNINNNSKCRDGQRCFLKKLNYQNDIVCPSDDNFSCFAKGREYGSSSITHQYTEQEREMLADYESLEYLPYHSYVYREWTRNHPAQ